MPFVICRFMGTNYHELLMAIGRKEKNCRLDSFSFCNSLPQFIPVYPEVEIK